MKLRYLIFAEKVILERDNLEASAMNITDEVEMFIADATGAPVLNPETLPLNAVLLMVWERQGEAAGSYPVEIAFIAPDGSEISRHPGPPVVFSEDWANRKFLGRIQFNGVPCRGSGAHGIAVYKPGEANPERVWDLNVILHSKVPAGATVKSPSA